jgi:hypothetical protein
VLQPSKDVPPIRWSSIKDPHIPGALPEGAHPIHVSLHAGDAVSSLWSALWPTSDDALMVSALSACRVVAPCPARRDDGRTDDRGELVVRRGDARYELGLAQLSARSR